VARGFDTVGPLARSAEDCALVLEAIAGRDPGDPATAGSPERHPASLGGGLSGLRVGVVRSLFAGPYIDTRVAAALEEALDVLRDAGAQLLHVEIDLLDQFGVIQQAMQFAEATEVHLEHLRTRLDRYGDDVRARLLTGLYLPATAYVLGQRARRVALAAFEEALGRVDVFAAPAMGVLPPPIGRDTVRLADGSDIPYRLTVIPYNSPWSCVGAPAVSVPAGSVDGLPVGLAVAGARFADATVLQVAHAFQQLTDWHKRRAPLLAETVRHGAEAPR
jgi:aspartyl-tRNA(Asn)/glutamyl-tRNA(Gln) amidotransferase subunit A